MAEIKGKNKGEWSEMYIFFKLMSDRKLHFLAVHGERVIRIGIRRYRHFITRQIFLNAVKSIANLNAQRLVVCDIYSAYIGQHGFVVNNEEKLFKIFRQTVCEKHDKPAHSDYKENDQNIGQRIA